MKGSRRTLLVGAVFLVTGCSSFLTLPSTPGDQTAAGRGSQLILDGGIAYDAGRVLAASLLQGSSLASGRTSTTDRNLVRSSGFHVLAQYSGLQWPIQEAQNADGSWDYTLTLDPNREEWLSSSVRNQATASGSFQVPDEAISEDWLYAFEATESVPPDAPPGAIAARGRVTLKVSALKALGTLVEHRVEVPSGPDSTLEWRTVQESVDLRIHLRGVPTLDGKPLKYRSVATNFTPRPNTWDLAGREEVQETWPDGMVLSQVSTRSAGVIAETTTGTLTFADGHAPVSFQQTTQLDPPVRDDLYVAPGMRLSLRYRQGILTGGDLHDDHGRLLGIVLPFNDHAVQLKDDAGRVLVIEAD